LEIGSSLSAEDGKESLYQKGHLILRTPFPQQRQLITPSGDAPKYGLVTSKNLASISETPCASVQFSSNSSHKHDFHVHAPTY